MPSITLKGLPPALHRELKARAKAHHRSLNKEVILTLETATAGARGADLPKVIEEARQARSKFARTIRASEISAWKKHGRL